MLKLFSKLYDKWRTNRWIAKNIPTVRGPNYFYKMRIDYDEVFRNPYWARMTYYELARIPQNYTDIRILLTSSVRISETQTGIVDYYHPTRWGSTFENEEDVIAWGDSVGEQIEELVNERASD